MFTLGHLLFDHFQFALIYGPNMPGSYAILFFTASDLASITSHIHSWVLFLLWLHPFILSGVISPLISGSILGTYRLGEFIFQCPIFLPFHTVHGVLKARILKWFAIPFSNRPHSVRPLHHHPTILGGPTQRGNAKECSNYCTIALISHASKVMLKILQTRLQQYVNHELPDVQAGFRKGKGTRDQIASSRWIIEKAREFQKNIYFCFIDYAKAFDCVDHNKLWKILQEMEY